MYELLVTGGEVVDPLNHLHGVYDIGIAGGKIVEVASEIDPGKSKRTFDVTGKTIIPGIIDMHVHTGFERRGPAGMAMMARAGTATAMDCGGPLEEFFFHSINYASGLNMLCLQMVRPDWNLSGTDPPESEIRELVDKSLEAGAVGLKILGGHYPMTPEATRRVIEVCNEKKVYVAFHTGTIRSGAGNLNTFKEAIELTKGLSVQIVHVNSYCRGQVLGDPVTETMEVLSLLEQNPNVFAESYLSIFSGAPGKCSDGMIDSIGTANSLGMGGYPKNEVGLRQAILDGFAAVVVECGDRSERKGGPEGLACWEQNDGDVTVTFPVTPAATRFLLATQKSRSGRFLVDALATDGGGIPRNFIVEKGTALVRMDALTWEEFVIKTSCNPARILGLHDKGHLGVGADADLSILEGCTGKTFGLITDGQIVMVNGRVIGTVNTIMTSETGVQVVRRLNLRVKTFDLKTGWFYRGRPEVS